MIHCTRGTSLRMSKCSAKGTTETQPPVIIPVTMAAFVENPMSTSRRYVVRAGPIPILGTNTRPPPKDTKANNSCHDSCHKIQTIEVSIHSNRISLPTFHEYAQSQRRVWCITWGTWTQMLQLSLSYLKEGYYELPNAHSHPQLEDLRCYQHHPDPPRKEQRQPT